MIRMMEEHIAAWMKGQLEALVEESGLFGPVRTAVGQTEPVFEPSLSAGDVGLAIRVSGVAPLPDNNDFGASSLTPWPTFRMTARMELTVLGDDAVLVSADDREMIPAGTHMHRVDLAVLTLLSLLRAPAMPAPDGAGSSSWGDSLGQQLDGAASAAQGARKSQLYWTAIEAGEAELSNEGFGGQRQWHIPLAASCTYRLSPAAQNGGTILQTRHQLERMDGGGKTGEVAAYASGDAIPLAYFDVLLSPTITELGGYGVSKLGDLAKLGAARTAELAGRLRTATDAERDRLAKLAEMAVFRASSGVGLLPFQLDPEMYALPARALFAPTAAEHELLLKAVALPDISVRIALLALPVIALMKPEYREAIAFGTALTIAEGA